MAPYIDSLIQDEATSGFQPVISDLKPVSVAGLRYTKDQLLSLRPVSKDKSIAVSEAPAVSIVEGEDTVKPGQPLDTAVEQQSDIPDHGLDEGAVTEKKQKRKKSKKSGKNKKAPTGFEEFYADPPVTPLEYEEEFNDIYHHTRSFVERIQQCIQRYRARRKLDAQRANIFSKYLALGGIETGLKAFNGGLDQDTLDNSTAEEIAQMQAIDYVRSSSIKFYNAGNPVDWVIDFEAGVKGFLSHKAPSILGIDTPQVKEYCGVIRNFLNYVLIHGVCPEFTPSILASRKICDLAIKEWQQIGEISPLLPGNFNKAASTLYGGEHHGNHGNHGSDTWWSDGGPLTDDEKKLITGMSFAEAERIFKTAVAFMGTWEHFDKMIGTLPCVVRQQFRPMEVCEIILPDQEMKKKYAGTKDEYGNSGNIKPLGLLKVKHWDNPEAGEEDMSDDEDKADHMNGRAGSVVDAFWLEEDVLKQCFIGMKFSAVVRDLNIGIKYFDEIAGVHCSFHTYLPTERLSRWKEPVRNPRPARTVDDLDRPDDNDNESLDD